jgi:hypothetical protein
MACVFFHVSRVVYYFKPSFRFVPQLLVHGIAELFVQSLHSPHWLTLAVYHFLALATYNRPRTGHVMRNPDNVTLVLVHRICSPIELLTRYPSTTLELGDKRELSSKS